MNGRLERAKLYYFIATREAILDLGDNFYNHDVAHTSILQAHPNLAQRPSILKKSESLFRICLEDFVKAGWIDSIGDEFAPLFIRRNASLVKGPISNPSFRQLYDKYESLGDSKHAWLDSALTAAVDSFLIEELRAVLDQISNNTDLGSNFTELTSIATDDSWSPIPLDRSDPDQTTALKALEKTIEELRGDNGYGATNPEEKAFVQDHLAAVAKRLKDDSQISWMYLNEFAFKPLAILIKRFGQATIGITASLAREAVSSWLKSKGLNFLDDMFK